MKRTISMSVLPVLAAFGASAQAQQADFELVVEGVHGRDSETALPVTIMDEEQLEDAARVTLGDTLAGRPGINTASFGPAVGQPVIRGHQGHRVMNLTNHIANADASGNSADHANTIEPMLAERVEILKGPSTLLYGGGAIGGVVNVIDNRIPDAVPPTPTLGLELRHDTASDLDTAVGHLEFATGNLVWHLDGTRRDWNELGIPGLAIDPAWLAQDQAHAEEESEGEAHEGEVENTDGFIANTGGENESATGGVSWVFDSGHVGFAVNRYESFYGLPPGAHALGHEEEGHEGDSAGDGVSIDMASTRYDLTAVLNDIHPVLESLSYRLSHTDYGHAEIEGGGEIGTRFSNDSWQQRLQLTHPTVNGWHGVLGLQTVDDRFAAVGEESFVPPTDIATRGIFLIEALDRRPFTFEFGARLNRDELEPETAGVPARGFTTASYSGSMLWDFDATSTLGVSLTRSERAPAVEELYSNFALADLENCVIHFATGSCELGNTAIGEEKSNNLDVTLYADYCGMSSTLAVFYNGFEDYIYLDNTGQEVDEQPVRTYRQSDATFRGLEADVTFELGDVTQLRIYGDLISGKLGTGEYVPRMPPARIGSELTFRFLDWSVYLSMLHAAEQDEPGQNEWPTDGYTRWDAGAEYRFMMPGSAGGELTLLLKGRNLTDEEIRLSTSFLRGFAPEAGRSVEFGVRYNF